MSLCTARTAPSCEHMHSIKPPTVVHVATVNCLLAAGVTACIHRCATAVYHTKFYFQSLLEPNTKPKPSDNQQPQYHKAGTSTATARTITINQPTVPRACVLAT